MTRLLLGLVEESGAAEAKDRKEDEFDGRKCFDTEEAAGRSPKLRIEIIYKLHAESCIP